MRASAPEPVAAPASTADVLEVRDLTVSFASEHGSVDAVRGVSYRVRPGEVLGIVGESGSGKSVSALAVMGLLPRSARVAGSARLNGTELLGGDDKAWRRVRGRKIAMVFQDPLSALTPVYSVGDQVAEAITTHRPVGRAEARRRSVELLDLVGIPNAASRVRAFPHEFSGGMRQRVMIAMAVANDPDIIIADEPTTALDVTIQAQVLEVFKTVQQATGAAVVLITHDLGVVAGFADRVLVMYAGKPVEMAQVDRLFAAPSMPYTIGLLGSIPRLDTGRGQPLTPIDGAPPALVALPAGCPFEPRCPVRVDACREVEPSLVDLGDGHAAACHRAGEVEAGRLSRADIFPARGAPADPAALAPREQRPTVLRVTDLARHFPITRGVLRRRHAGAVHAVDGISFGLRTGETLGLVGESGCGKTTTIMEILSLARPMAGSIDVLGRRVGQLSRADRMATRRDVQVVFQDPMASLDPRLPVADILAEPLRTHGVARSECDRRVRELLELVGLNPALHLSRYPSEFSGGQRQRIGIARALALEPKLLVLDEPVSALDVSIQAGVLNLLAELKARLRLSYLFVAHDLAVVRHLADRVAVMYLGRIVEIGEVDAVFGAPSHPYTQALLSAIPLPDPAAERSRTRILLSGDLPSAVNPPGGCRFRSRCPKFATLSSARQASCVERDPALAMQPDGGHEPAEAAADHGVACHYPEAMRFV
ncbi:MAG TPA: ABC transporter ATP-binding protein [Jatrophihabitantaceae bacterium]|jgi:peptide/nickel transport system ATP-binding protein|nr:ABC transporter ATP-binding protein [Jatrophihabitantaceae bacterium]